MRILHTEASCGWGGQEIRILDEAAGMIDRGHEVWLACPPQAPIARAAPARGLRVLTAPLEKKRPAGLFAMRALLREHPFDVVNSHSSTDSWLAALACASLKAGPPLVRTRHISAPVARTASNRWLYARASRFVVTTGERLRRELIEGLGCDPQRVVSIPTGIDHEKFRPVTGREERAAIRAQLGLPDDRYLVGIVATLRSWKGHRYLIDAVAAMKTRVQLVIVGEGPQHEALLAQAAALGRPDLVRFAGQQADVAPWMRALDAFALPSYANEGVPQALMQAMFTGLPCVTTDAGAIGEIAVPGRTAVVVPMQDSAVLTAALSDLQRDPAWRSALGERARAHVLDGFTRDRMLDRMSAVFEAATQAGPAGVEPARAAARR
ncbi:MAG TPA: glycosyltransferase family 4 protein [Burkholderiaceae bacterium]|jgi:glycosyltransferase involved in cell wall biosynthesis|nr:glycosyltransferase family 4 protein [Burkholderiaceae bacterium]